jgi:HlyD family type I secretion membrane fusion protein
MNGTNLPVLYKGAVSDDAFQDARKGLWIAGAFFIGLLGWAALTPLDAGAYAEGVVAVSGKRQVVQHKEGGIVSAIEVQEGETVRKGQVLFIIAASELKATERALSGQVISLLAERARLVAERTGLASFEDPVEFASLRAEDRPLAVEAMQGQRILFNARRRSLVTQKGALRQRELQLGEQIAGYRHQITSNREQQKLIEDELTGMRSLAEKGFASVNKVRALERNAASLNGDYGAYTAQIAGTSEAIGEARMQGVSLDRQLVEGVATQLSEVQVQLDELQPKLAAVREQMARAIVRAPASGKVVGLTVFTVGGVVAPGDTLMEIVPQDRNLVVEAKIAPNDADDLAVGQETQVKFSALHERSIPMLTGRITQLSADSFTDERTNQRYFRAEISVPESELAKIRAVRGQHTGLQAGLPVEIMVPLAKRTALAYLLEPLTQTLWRAGREH